MDDVLLKFMYSLRVFNMNLVDMLDVTTLDSNAVLGTLMFVYLRLSGHIDDVFNVSARLSPVG